MDFSVILPTFNEEKNIGGLIEKIRDILGNSGYSHEIIVADAGSTDNTFQVAKEKGAQVFIQKRPGYGGALKDAVELARGTYIITIDADFSHNPYVIKRLICGVSTSHILIASRYIRGGLANMPLSRRILSIILNKSLSFGLSLPVKDISSGFRLYHAEIFKEIDFSEENFSVLMEILVKAYMHGFRVREIPFHYQPRAKGRSHAKIIKFGCEFLRTFLKMWKMRNTIASADYDERAFYSRIPLQRFWQRQRYKIIIGFVGYFNRILDAGCGTSKILGAFPQAVGLDINFKKLRFNLSLGNSLVNGYCTRLCFKDDSFDALICSEVIEHLKDNERIFLELKRVLKQGGILVLGTPDYSRWSWVMLEWLYKRIVPGGYADEHITHYTQKGLVQKLQGLGFQLEAKRYILGSELICKYVKLS
ncbi:MAG: glycosyltransferase [Candidatus Omnitrophica bacterium]|nr:glycosyltransferase [Candidatus Omnitrophota bacterium]